jgi:glycosyltransferase involved in cell wall biosynthesis
VENKLGYICGNESWGGLEMNQFRNALWMQERGHQVVIICLKGSPIEKQALEAKIPILHILKHRKYYDFSNGKKLAMLIKQQQITHLIVRATLDMSIAAIAKRKMGKRLHLSYFMEMQLGIKKTNPLHTLRFSYFDLWSCPLHWLKDQVVHMTHFSKDKITVIPSGIDLRSFASLPSLESARETLDLPKDMLLFGLIGRFDVHKGQLLLLEAMSKCKTTDFGIVLLGEPTRNEGTDYFDEMKRIIQENKLNNRVFIRPFRKDIGTFYKAVDWFVMASKAETFGMVTIEAMACGTPTLGSNAGGTPELLQNGQLGVLFNTLDSLDLAEKITKISTLECSVDSEELLHEAQRFDHDLVCQQVEKALGI